MAHNPLLGSRISLISKKNIRYEGTLYSINEADATVALQNVRSYGTEGRESESETFVPPQDQVHPYLLFRGCDIKDLHVHENTVNEAPPSDPAIISAGQPPEVSKTPTSAPVVENVNKSKEENAAGTMTSKSATTEASSKQESVSIQKDATKHKKSTRQNKPKQMVGSGASLLNRKTRGAVDGVEGPEKDLDKDFDFESNLAEFNKDDDASDESNEDEAVGAYSKDNFFDSLSNDILDRQSGVDNRLRGAQERSLNTETFGATALDSGRYRRGGRGRGRGRGRGGRGRGRGGGRRQYGDGGLSNNRAISSSN